MYRKIIMAGDSWGEGEWKKPNPTDHAYVSHRGLENFFKQAGYQVINTSMGGNDPHQIKTQLQEAVQEYRYHEDLFILIITTCWLRGDESPKWDLDVNEFRQLRQKSKTKWLKDVNKFLEGCNQVGHLLGALGTINKSDIEQCNSLRLINGNLVNFFDPDNPVTNEYEIYTGDYNWKQIQWYLRRARNKELTEYLYNQKMVWEQIAHDNPAYLDNAHPNRHLHHKLFNHILTNYLQ